MPAEALRRQDRLAPADLGTLAGGLAAVDQGVGDVARQRRHCEEPVVRIPGKPDGLDGRGVAALAQAGHYADIAAYCKADVLATYRLFLAHERFLGAIDPDSHRVSEAELAQICA